MGLNLVVVLDMLEREADTSGAGDLDVNLSRIKLNPADYDGATYCIEVVVDSTDTVDRYVYLKDVAGNTYATITIPANDSPSTTRRKRSIPFTPAAADTEYRLVLGISSQLLRYKTARIIVTQINATKTRLQFPLVNGCEENGGTGGATVFTWDWQVTGVWRQFGEFGIFLKEEAKLGATIGTWTLETVCSKSYAPATAKVGLFNKTDDAQVTGVEISVGTSYAVQTYDFANDAENFHDGDEFECRVFYSGATGAGSMGRCALYVKITDLNKALVYWRVTRRPASQNIQECRMLFDPSQFSASVYHLEATGTLTAGGNKVRWLANAGGADTGTTGWTKVFQVIPVFTTAKVRRRVTMSFQPPPGRLCVSYSNSTGTLVMSGMFLVMQVDPTATPPSAPVYYLDPANGNDVNDGSSWANAWQTSKDGASLARLNPGATIRIAKTPSPVYIGDAVWTHGNATLTLTAAGPIKFLGTHTEATTGWVASAGISFSMQNGPYGYLSGKQALRITTDGTITTARKLAYKDLGSNIDLSTWRQLAAYGRITGAVSAGIIEVKFCSDTTGDTPVDTFANENWTTNKWHIWTKDKGSVLGSAIRSIAIYCTGSFASNNFEFYELFVTTLTGLTWDSIIGTTSAERGSVDGLYGLYRINSDTELCLDAVGGTPGGGNTYGNPYAGTSGTKPVYSRQPYRYDLIGNTGAYIESVEEGLPLSPITYSGGWNKDTTIQDGETWMRTWETHYATAITHDFVDLERLSFKGGIWGVTFTHTRGNRLEFDGIISHKLGLQFNGCAQIEVEFNFMNSVYWDMVWYNTIRLIYGCQDIHIKANLLSGGNYTPGVSFIGCLYCSLNIPSIQYVRAPITADYSHSCKVRNTLAEHLYDSSAMGYGGSMMLENYSETSFGGVFQYYWRIIMTDRAQTADSHERYMWNGSILAQTAVRIGSDGVAWRMTPSTTNAAGPRTPLRLEILKVPVASGDTVNVSTWFRKSHANHGGRLFIQGGQMGGPVDDSFTDMTVGADSWELLSLSPWTADKDGVVIVEAWAWGTTATQYVYVDAANASVS